MGSSKAPKEFLRESPFGRVPSGESLNENIVLKLMAYYAYILKSLSRNTHYYGSTGNLEKRVKEHNSGKVRYSKGRMPWKLHYFEVFESRSEAMKREKYFKSIDGYLFLKDKGII